jgi:hypothetical protein
LSSLPFHSRKGRRHNPNLPTGRKQQSAPSKGGNVNKEKNIMSSLVCSKAPDFEASAVMGNNEIKDNFKLSEHLNGSYGLVFFYPLDRAGDRILRRPASDPSLGFATGTTA